MASQIHTLRARLWKCRPHRAKRSARRSTARHGHCSGSQEFPSKREGYEPYEPYEPMAQGQENNLENITDQCKGGWCEEISRFFFGIMLLNPCLPIIFLDTMGIHPLVSPFQEPVTLAVQFLRFSSGQNQRDQHLGYVPYTHPTWKFSWKSHHKNNSKQCPVWLGLLVRCPHKSDLRSNDLHHQTAIPCPLWNSLLGIWPFHLTCAGCACPPQIAPLRYHCIPRLFYRHVNNLRDESGHNRPDWHRPSIECRTATH